MAEGLMTFLFNLTLKCYYFEQLLSRDVNTPGDAMWTKMAEGWITFQFNLTLPYYFETLLLSRDVNTPRRCDVNKDGGVNDLSV